MVGIFELFRGWWNPPVGDYWHAYDKLSAPVVDIHGQTIAADELVMRRRVGGNRIEYRRMTETETRDYWGDQAARF